MRSPYTHTHRGRHGHIDAPHVHADERFHPGIAAPAPAVLRAPAGRAATPAGDWMGLDGMRWDGMERDTGTSRPLRAQRERRPRARGMRAHSFPCAGEGAGRNILDRGRGGRREGDE